MKRTGMTLIELIVYMALSILAGFLILALYQLATRAQNETISSYVVGGDTETAIRRLRRELQETALVSLQTYPSDGNTSEKPGCSFTSARNSDGDAALNVSTYGAPQWRKNVFYTVNPTGAQTGQLVRWEKDLSAAEMDFVPRPTAILPSTMGTKQQSVPLKLVLLANTKVEHLSGSPNYITDGFGGFRVQFVRRKGGEAGAETLSSINP
ncbi:unnamed protein product, partial [Phaeothamnion confervicola]